MAQSPDLIRAGFLRLPPRTRRRLLAVVGKRAPWDAKFRPVAPAVPAGMVTGPPDVVGVGVQKAGTTWWFSLLTAHPGFYDHPGCHKERHFFSRYWEGKFSEKDRAAYERWFPRPPGLLTGEWTPDYLHQHWVPPLLHQAAPRAKLLVLLRDPVERYISGLAHNPEHGQRVDQNVACDAFARGFSADALERLEALYGPGSILVLQYEACRDSPASNLAATLRFIGLDDTWVPSRLGRPINPTSGTKLVLGGAERQELAERYACEIARLANTYPQLDLDRWPSARLARRATR